MRHVVQVEDISTRKRLEEEQRFFAELGPVLASSLERDVILYRVAEVCARRLADHCLVVSIDDESGVRVKRLLSRDPSRQALADAIETYRLDPSRPSLVGRAVELQRPILLREPTDEALQAMAQNEDHLRLLRELGMTSSLTIPLIASGQVVGAMALISCGDSRLFDAGDVRWVEELGWRTAIALENARLYRAALKAANARDEVLAVVAHDLRNPLSTIANQAVLLRRRAQPRAGTEAQAGEMIQHAVGRMDRLIKDLLDVSRMEAGRFSVELAEVDATALVRDCVASQSGLAQQAGLEITADIPQDLTPLRADRDRLLQVFENLIGNAIKFAGTGGHIHVGAAAQESHVVFTVQDDGPGVAPEDLRRLFDRFWQGRRARREGAG
ncbi:MAG: HAMP domain-containing histidine kinase, partial [Comamonadaceae bacterium]